MTLEQKIRIVINALTGDEKARDIAVGTLLAIFAEEKNNES